jgi:hypothetical protein
VASFCAVAALLRPPLQIYLAVAAPVGGCILAVSAYRIWQLSEGGEAFAELLGARYVDPWKCSPTERKLLNVVEEMAIASGIAVPPVYLLERENTGRCNSCRARSCRASWATSSATSSMETWRSTCDWSASWPD